MSTQLDIADFCGQEFAPTPAERKRAEHSTPRRAGYAYMPGTGPEGETCGSCRHIFRTNKYRKCKLRQKAWTHGFATDILASARACKLWEIP